MVGKAEGQLLKLAVVLGAGLEDPLPLLLKHLHEGVGLVFSALAQLTPGALSPLGGQGFKPVLELGHIRRQRGPQLLLDGFLHRWQAFAQAGFQVGQGHVGLGGVQHPQPPGRICWIPFGHQLQHLIVQASSAVAVQRQPGKKNKFGGVVMRGDHRGSAQLFPLEPPHQEAVEQPLHQGVLKMQVHPVGVHLLGVFEHHRLGRCVASPFPELLAGLAWAPQCIQHIPPALLASGQLIGRREDPFGPLGIGLGCCWILSDQLRH